ncbi:IPT/TIG domain-containing protein [Candidatus Saganbacteria bacterium]|nr:IPT/TIG domain-containing protein [Candidatus Saganbacteria bacterium]
MAGKCYNSRVSGRSMFKKLLYASVFVLVLGAASFAAVTYPVQSAISPKDMFPGTDRAVGYLFIPDTLDGSSRLIIKKVFSDTTPAETAATISLPGKPFGIAVSPDGKKTYVAVSGATQSIKVYLLNETTGTWSESTPAITFSGFLGLRGLAVAPDGKRLYAADALANKVHVIDIGPMGSRTVIASIDVPVVSDVYGVAVSPDNALLAVTRKTTSGSLFVYRIERELDGTISYPQLWSQSGLYYPNYPIFSPDSKRLYVRVHELSGSYNDVNIYENPNRLTAPTPLAFRVPYDIATSEAYTGNNRGGEALTLSSNGQYLYLIHYRVYTSPTRPVEARFYRVSNLNRDGSARTNYSDYPRVGGADELNEGLMYATSPGTPTPYDGLVATPDGARVWMTCSEGGYSGYVRYTGFTEYPSGVLTNAVPGEPGIVHPASASGDNLNNYTTGAVQWTDGVDDSPTINYHFEVSYKRTSSSTWTTPTDFAWLPSTTHNVTLPTSLSYNQWYVVQVRMHDGTYWSDPAYSEPFKKSFPTIASIEVDANGDPTVSDWRTYDYGDNIGHIYDTVRIRGSGFGTVSSPWTSGDGDHSQIQFGVADKFGNYYYYVMPGQEGADRRILSWEDSEIIMMVPRAFKDGTIVKANNVRVKVKSNDLTSSYKQFRVGPVITEMTPRNGLAGDASVTITGAGFSGSALMDEVYFFNNQLASITSRTSTANYDQLVVSVPSTATTGRVIVRNNSIDSAAEYQGNPHGTYNEPVVFTVDGVAVQNVAVTSPNGGETLTAGSTANITWTSSGITNVRIRYSTNGGTSWGTVIASTPAAAGTYAWVVPNSPTTQGRIEISDAGDNTPLDTSDANFTIQTGGTTQVLIDDFEGGTVDPTTGYFAPFGTNPVTRTRQSTTVDSGSYAMQALYSWTGGDPEVNWGGGWGGSLRTNQNIGITGLDRVKFRVRGDTGLNVTTYFIQVTTTDDKAYRSVTKTLPATTAWTTEEAMYTQMWNEMGATPNGAPDPGEELFSARTDKTIKSYSIVYNGHNTTPITANHYIDNIVAASSGAQPSSISTAIARAGDTVGSGINLSWTVSDGYAGTYNIYRKTGAWDAADGVFNTTAASWGTPWRSSVMSPVTDDTQVGQGTQTYYKVVKSAETLSDAMLLTDVVGKFDLAVGPSDTQPEKFFISVPLVPIAPLTDFLTDAFGAQIGEGDGILTFNMNKDVLTGSLYSGGAWSAFPGATAITNVSWGRSYGYLTMTEKYLTVVGKVPESPNLLSLTGGWDGTHDYAAVAEWIANSYPVPVTITTSALGSSTSRGTSPLDGGTVYQFNANADLMGGVDGMAVNTAAGWVSGTLTDPSTLRLVPGRGYMLNEPVNSAFTWAQPKPY